MSDEITMEVVIAPKAKKSKLWTITVLALLLAAAAIFIWQYNANRSVSTDYAKVTGDTVDISPKIGGRLEQLAIKEGDTVKAGQLVASLDNKQYKLALDQAQANLVQAESDQRKLPMDQKSAQATCEKAQQTALSAQAQVENSQITVADSLRILNKNKSLFAAGALSQESLDKSQSDYEKALTTLRMNEANLAAAQASITDAQAKLEIVANTSSASYQAKVKQARAVCDLALLNYQNSYIKAPINGKVVRITEKVGENLSVGQTVLTLCDLDKTWVVANINEGKIGRIKPGQAVDVRIDAYPDQVFKGRVDSIADTTKSVFSVLSSENASGNYTKVAQYLPVKIVVDHKGKILRSGMSASVKIKVK